MNSAVRGILLLTATFFCGGAPVCAAGPGTVNLVPPVAPATASAATSDDYGTLLCGSGLVAQSDSQCCPAGTDNTIRPWACTPPGVTDRQLFKGPGGVPLYCPGSDMFIVANSNSVWFSCADRDSTPFYPATALEGGIFCNNHGYGYLVRIEPWGTVGCVKVGESQGNGCIEAGTCYFVGGD